VCGIFGISNNKEAARLTYLGLYALQHRGEESAGIVARCGKKVNQFRGMGLVGDVFKEREIKSLKGDMGVGHVRYSTTGSSNPKNIQPFLVKHKKAISQSPTMETWSIHINYAMNSSVKAQYSRLQWILK